MRQAANFCDFFILLSASSSRRAQAIVEHIQEGLREKRIPIRAHEGLHGSSWIVLDLFDVVVHIFTEGAREYYNLDRLWADAPVVNIPTQKNAHKRAYLRRPPQSADRKVSSR